MREEDRIKWGMILRREPGWRGEAWFAVGEVVTHTKWKFEDVSNRVVEGFEAVQEYMLEKRRQERKRGAQNV